MPKKLFKNLSLSQKTVLYFKSHGFKAVESRTGKYNVLFSGTRYYFIGKSGAIRVNNRNSASSSRSFTDHFKPQIKKWADAQDQKAWIVE
jgi:hypothetical protein